MVLYTNARTMFILVHYVTRHVGVKIPKSFKTDAATKTSGGP